MQVGSPVAYYTIVANNLARLVVESYLIDGYEAAKSGVSKSDGTMVELKRKEFDCHPWP